MGRIFLLSKRMNGKKLCPSRLKLFIRVGLSLCLLFILSFGLPFDFTLINWAYKGHTYKSSFIAGLLTNLGSPTVLLSLTLLCGGLLLTIGRKSLALFLCLNILGVSVLNEGVKQVVRRSPVVLVSVYQPAPEVFNKALVIPSPKFTQVVYAFPSGHAAGSASVFLALNMFVKRKRWRWITTYGGGLLVLLIGFSRIYLGAHTLSDVLGGWTLAYAFFSLLSEIPRFTKAYF